MWRLYKHIVLSLTNKHELSMQNLFFLSNQTCINLKYLYTSIKEDIKRLLTAKQTTT